MENAVEALKMAFGVMMFVLALSMSISYFSRANSAVQSIVMYRDRETEYTYVNQTEGLSRIVGVESIIPAMYKAYKENIEIYFFKASGEPLNLYQRTDSNGNHILINYINPVNEIYADSKEAKEHLDTIIGMGTATTNAYDNKYYNQFIYSDGLYEELKKYTFEEKLGEYYQNEGASQIKKRVITYTITNN